MSRSNLVTMVFLAVAATLATTAAADQIWRDGEFVEEDWDLVEWISPLDSGESGADLAFTLGHGGHPDAQRSVAVDVGEGPDDGAMAVHVNNGHTWDPAVLGPVLGLDVSLDFRSTNLAPTRIGIVVEQAGVFYLHVLAPAATDDYWFTYAASGLVASDFPPLDPAAIGQPDFSATGAPMRMGFASGQLMPTAAGFPSFYHALDNWIVTIDGEPLSAVAEGRSPTAQEPPTVWPNPFNPTTTVSFALDAPGFASLRVFDLAGRLVRVLETGRLDAGEHATVWRGRDLAGRRVASGVYLAVLETAGGVTSRRLTLAR
jgi:hypothetical protein